MWNEQNTETFFILIAIITTIILIVLWYFLIINIETTKTTGSGIYRPLGPWGGI